MIGGWHLCLASRAASPFSRTQRYGLKPGTVAVKSKTGALGGSSIRGVKVASSGFKAQSTSDPRASGFTVVPVSVRTHQYFWIRLPQPIIL